METIITRSTLEQLPNRTMMNSDGVTMLVDKPIEWTSFDVVKKVRTLFHLDKVGHAGTLDPKATGLLILCTGRKTKSLDSFAQLGKEYTGAMLLGKVTPSFDSETTVTEERDFTAVTPELLSQSAAHFVGRQEQIPPMYSATKHGGKPLYKYARKGRVLRRESKEIDVTVFELTRLDLPTAHFRIVCSKGTYVRSLVYDLGQRLGCGAMLMTLRRTRIGAYSVGDALTIPELMAWKDRSNEKNELIYASRVSA
jgi:tRNA pseudouridine55 synthase